LSDPIEGGIDGDVARLALKVCRRIDVEGAASMFLRAALDHTRTSIGLVYLYDAESDVFRLQCSTFPSDDPWRDEIATLDLAELRGTGAPESWPPAVRSAPGALRGKRLDPILAYPLTGGGRLFGFLLLADPLEATLEAALPRARRLVPEMLTGLLNARQVESYRELVIKDDQSDCYNRRYFDRCLSEEVYRAQRYGSALSVVFLDLDNLKELNVRFGHAVGSKTVREVSRRLVAGIRGSDRAFRYGGDEFCVVLPGTDLSGACEGCERLRLSIATRPFIVDAATQVVVTASFGIAAYPDHARTSLGLIKCADEAMQIAKGLGKNSVRVAVKSAEGRTPRAQGGGA
jgi:diguanylate cyclase (GGDEF)-like protein